VSDSSPQVDPFFYGADTPMGGLRQMLSEVRGDRFNNGFEEPFPIDVFEGPDGFPIPVPPPPGFPGQPVDGNNPNLRGIDQAVPYWLQYVITMTALSAAAIWLSIRRVRTPAKVER